jgi:hypothetical protein
MEVSAKVMPNRLSKHLIDLAREFIAVRTSSAGGLPIACNSEKEPRK